MCGRFVGNFAVADLVADLLAGGLSVGPTGMLPGILSNFNTAPTHESIILANRQGPSLGTATWGFTPKWSKAPSQLLINARSETVHEKPSFRGLLGQHRAAVPMSGFYEWDRSNPRDKRPYYVRRADGRIMWVAGLRTGGDAAGESFVILTRPSTGPLEGIHDRSPVLLDVGDAIEWVVAQDAPLGLCALVDPPDLAMHEVGRAVNNVRNNTPGLVEPVPAGTDPGATLF